YYTGHTPYAGKLFTAPAWHGFEMFAGFASALVAGFLLTASANWAGVPHRGGWPLVALTAAWLVERVVPLLPAIPEVALLLIQWPYTVLFLYLLFAQLRTNPKNFRIFMPWLLLFLTARHLYALGGFLEDSEIIALARNLFVADLRLLIVIITGRIIPFFMSKRIGFRPGVPPVIEYASVLSIGALFIPDLLPVPDRIETAFFCLALIANCARFLYWRPWRTWPAPLLWILHAGYLWLLLHLLARGVPDVFPGVGEVHLHIFTAGALGTFAIGMMTRVALGHTGRLIEADRWIVAMYICVFIGAFLRIAAPVWTPGWYIKSLHYSSGFWTLAFLIYLIRFVPILFGPRPDGRPG
ncbi:MAG: NnrS family protein, partial [Leptospirales bacterium]